MRKIWGGLAMLAVLLRTGWARAQAPDPVGGLPVWTGRPPLTGAGGYGSAPYRTPQTTTYGVLQEMASRAAVIFVGTVTAVRISGGDGDTANVAAGVVSIEFRVEEGVLGPATGTTYVVREWAGLWRDAARYRVGERRLMLLHAPSAWGLSSPVDGLDGAIPVVGDATPKQQSGPSTPALPASRADLRWIQAKQFRTVIFALDPVANPGESAAPALGAAAGGYASPARLGPQDGKDGHLAPRNMRPANPQESGVALAGAPLAAEENPTLVEVIALLRGGGAPPHADR